MSVDEVVRVTSQTAEGVKSCAPLLTLAHDHGVAMSVVEAVVAVVHEQARPVDVIPPLVG
jgi:glycerol-3-phosphate dehydrogenase (NAD(P)+)